MVGEAQVVQAQVVRAAHQAQAGVAVPAKVVAAKAEGQGPVVEESDQVEVAGKTMGKVMGNVEGRERAAAGLKVGPARDEVELISISQ